jgi:hypothetical protein
MHIRTVLLLSLLAGNAMVAQAEDVGQHPAVFAPRQLPGVNPSTFIVGHPASPAWRVEGAVPEHSDDRVVLRPQLVLDAKARHDRGLPKRLP